MDVTPAGPWRLISHSNKTAIVRREDDGVIAAALLDGKGCETLTRGGRGTIQRFPIAVGTGIVRICRRGGLIRHLLNDAFVLANRPLREWQTHTFLFERGLSVPEPLGVCWERRGILYRGAVATREITGATTLLEFLQAPGRGNDDVVTDAGAVVRTLHEAGVYHGDLQVANVLVADGKLIVIDFGNARRFRSVTPVKRAQDLLRFRRSLEKNGLPHERFIQFCAGYGVGALPVWLDAAYRVKGAASNVLLRVRPRRERPRAN